MYYRAVLTNGEKVLILTSQPFFEYPRKNLVRCYRAVNDDDTDIPFVSDDSETDSMIFGLCLKYCQAIQSLLDGKHCGPTVNTAADILQCRMKLISFLRDYPSELFIDDAFDYFGIMNVLTGAEFMWYFNIRN